MNSPGNQGGKRLIYKRNPNGLSSDFLTENFQAWRGYIQGKETFKIMKEGNHESKIVYPLKLSFRDEGEIKAFPDNQKLREFTTLSSQ